LQNLCITKTIKGRKNTGKKEFTLLFTTTKKFTNPDHVKKLGNGCDDVQEQKQNSTD